MGEERRRTPRYSFAAMAEVIEQGSKAGIPTQVSELSLKGCYLDMPNPLPSGCREYYKDLHGQQIV